ncbi:putative beta-1-3-galactosyltransferase 2 [Nymphaea thermarum]|nr:putative beta-1-3-galactosyltransferase 2 [Nymphaea thermarum]
MLVKSRGMEASGRNLSRRLTVLLCLGSFCIGLLFTNRFGNVTDSQDEAVGGETDEMLKFISEGCNKKSNRVSNEPVHVIGEVPRNQYTVETLDKKISNLEVELAAARAAHESMLSDSLASRAPISETTSVKRQVFMVIGINTAFSSRKRRDSVRATWMPKGEKRKRLEEEKGIIIRFVIGHSATPGGILDRAIEAENRRHGDFMRLDHVEGYLELSAKTKIYFATAVTTWDADFYIKVDDDVHVNIGALGATLAKHQKKKRVYVGCMKSGPVLAQKGVRYHEPEYWKFGEEGNRYFRHATGQLYAISKDLASYILQNQKVLHKYANEDVSIGAWFIGLDVEHIDDRTLCCGTPPDCEWRARSGHACAASFDWSCSGICRSAERIFEIHRRCKEDAKALWGTA